MSVDFYLGVAPPEAGVSPGVLISHSILRAAARSGETTIYCGACSQVLARDVSVAGLSAAFGCAGHPLMVDCPRCGTHNIMPTDLPARASPTRDAA